MKKYKYEDLYIGMQVAKEELDNIEHVWMLVKYQHELRDYEPNDFFPYSYGTLVYFEKENLSNHSLDIRFKIKSCIINTKVNEDGSYGEFWGIYLYGYLNRYITECFPYEEVRDRAYQVASAIVPPKGQFEITIDTSFGKYIYDQNLEQWDDR